MNLEFAVGNVCSSEYVIRVSEMIRNRNQLTVTSFNNVFGTSLTIAKKKTGLIVI